MTTLPSIKNRDLLSFVVFSPPFKRLMSLLRRTLFASFLISFIWLPGLSSPALAVPIVANEISGGIASKIVDSAAEGARMNAFIACLPEQLSQPSLKRALSEMGNDQLERIFNLKAAPKLSQAESELKDCLSSKGFTNA